MSAGTSYDTGAPTTEVRIHRSSQLLMSDDEDRSIASATSPGRWTE